MESIRRNQMITADLPVHVSLPGIWQSFTSICPERRNKIDNFSPYECQICWINIFAITSQNNHNKTAHVFFLKVPTSSQDQQRTPCKKSTRLLRFITAFLWLRKMFLYFDLSYFDAYSKQVMYWAKKGKTLNSNADKFLYNNQQLIL